jgi:hypothetical protein
MKYIIAIIALLLFLNFYHADAFAWCITEKCKQEEVIKEEKGKKETVKQDIKCFYSLPFTKTKIYIFKADPVDSACPEIFQVGYIDTTKLKIVVLKEKVGDNLEIFHKPSFKNDENSLEENFSNLQEFVSETWPSSQEIRHRQMEDLE